MKLLALCVMTMAALCLSIFTGCAKTDMEENPALIEYGQDASAVTRARIVGLAEQIDVLQNQVTDALAIHDALLKDARGYRQKSNDAWTDPGLTEVQRSPTSKQYLEMAEDREAEAELYASRAKALDLNISRLDQQRKSLESRLDYLKKQAQAPAE